MRVRVATSLPPLSAERAIGKNKKWRKRVVGCPLQEKKISSAKSTYRHGDKRKKNRGKKRDCTPLTPPAPRLLCAFPPFACFSREVMRRHAHVLMRTALDHVPWSVCATPLSRLRTSRFSFFCNGAKKRKKEKNDGADESQSPLRKKSFFAGMIFFLSSSRTDAHGKHTHLAKAAESLGVDGGLVHEDLVGAVVRGDETETLLRVEPLHLRK